LDTSSSATATPRPRLNSATPQSLTPSNSATPQSTQSNSAASSTTTTRCGRSPSRTPPHDGRTPPPHQISKHHRGSFDSVDSSISSHTTGDESSLRLPTPTPTTSVRALTKLREEVDNCVEWGFPSPLFCSACTLFAKTRKPSALNLDSTHPADVQAVTLALSACKTFRSKPFQCRQLWKQDKDDISNYQHQEMRLRQIQFIEHSVVSRPPTPVVAAPTPSPTPFVAPSPSPATIPEDTPHTDVPVTMMVAVKVLF
jgi:hypothetical protein